jgi:hypothetical protein
MLIRLSRLPFVGERGRDVCLAASLDVLSRADQEKIHFVRRLKAHRILAECRFDKIMSHRALATRAFRLLEPPQFHLLSRLIA